MGDRLGIGGAVDRAIAGALAIDARLRRKIGLAEMVGEQLGLGLSQGREMLECVADPRMELLAAAAQEALVCGVPHQRMLEAVARLGRPALWKHEFSLDEAAERPFELVTTGGDHRREEG